MRDEDCSLSGQNLTWPQAMQRTKRLFKIVLGFTLLAIGAAMILLPGPGLLTIGLGLVVLAAEFIWARRLLNRLKEQAVKLRIFVSRRSDPKDPLGSR
jgi:O-antigen/teichoic acid export membrane protein